MKTILSRYITTVTLFFTCALANADDTEVFVNNTQNNVTPNLMFVLDLSGSMEFTPGGFPTLGVEKSRLEILQDSIASLLLDPELPPLNIGLASFQRDSGGTLSFPLAPKDADASTIDPAIPAGMTVSEVVSSIVANSEADGATPTVDQMHEVALYLRGEKPVMGSASFGSWDTTDNTYRGGWYRSSHPASYTGSVDYVPVGTPNSWTNTCNDYTGYAPGGDVNECLSVEAEGATLVCTTVTVDPDPGQTCNGGAGGSGTCDGSCGTRQVCVSGYDYTEPAACLNDPVSGGVWVTSTNSGEATQCCTSSDASGTECLGTTNYAASCSGPTQTQCNNYNNRNPNLGGTYQSCEYARVDNRVYTSPITQQCQKTAVVLLTDGDPSKNEVDRGETSGGSAQWPFRVRRMIADNDADTSNDRNDISCIDQSVAFGAGPGGYTSPNCLIELADFLHNNDQRPTIAGSTAEVYPIGFGLVGPVADATWGLLTDVATAGGGNAYVAGNQDELVEAFKNVVNSVSSSNQSFTSLSTSFNVSSLATANKTYMSMFEPNAKRSWEGNLKGYFLKDGELVDIQGNPATNAGGAGEVGFAAGAQSFWSAIPDGNAPTQGGFVSTLAPLSRKLYTITDPTQVSNVSLADGSHDLKGNNTNLTATLLGLPSSASAAQRTDTIDWLRSERIGDPLHAKPVIVDYGTSTGSVVYFMTNQGFLHAVNANQPVDPDGTTAGGDELFGFMPYELLGNSAAQAADTEGERIYGLDGQITVWKKDANRDGKIEGSDRVILFFNMRRGGNSYYALEVTNPNQPKLLWKISQGDTGFEALGQSWSRMTLARFEESGTTRDALVFGGGYDIQHDVLGTTRSPTGDLEGRGVYIVDALTGSLLMSIGNTVDFGKADGDMQYAMPADIRVIDSNGNGISDRLYAVDLGAQIWRVDIAEGSNLTAATSYTVNRLADFGTNAAGVADATTQRRFFYAPSVARYVRNNVLSYSISIGSGYRAHPLDTQVTDQVYALFDSNVATGAPTTTVSTVTLADMFDATSDLLSSADNVIAEAATNQLAGKPGWYITLETGEKVLSRVRVFRNRLLFNSFRPIGDGSTCGAVETANRFYALNAGNAIGLLPKYVNNQLIVGENSRGKDVADQTVILDEPVIISYHDAGVANQGSGDRPASSCSAVYAGNERQLNLCTPPVKVNWRRGQ